MQKIVLVDDDDKLREKVGDYLQSKDFEVKSFPLAEGVCDYIKENHVDLLLLDVMMPEQDGFSLARDIRAFSDVPILFFSASSDDVDKIIGLELGADDFVSKPVNPRELVARIKAILRRSSPDLITGKDTFRFGDFEINFKSYKLTKNGQVVDISSGEIELLIHFCKSANIVLSREAILDKLKSDNEESFDRSVDVRITRLRKRIETEPSKPKFLKTVRGQGYIFDPQGES
jgi:two-component system, OmpR family, phosphate regulon response regulator OmpR